MLSKVQLSTGLVSFRGEKPSTEDEVKLFPEGKTPEPGTFIPHVEKDPLDEFFKSAGARRLSPDELRAFSLEPDAPLGGTPRIAANGQDIFGTPLVDDLFELRSPAPSGSGDEIKSLIEIDEKLNKTPISLIGNKDNVNKPPKLRFPWKKLPAEQVPMYDAAAADVGGQVGKLPPVDKRQMLADIRASLGISTEGPTILEQLDLARRRGLLPIGTPRPAGKPLDLNALRDAAKAMPENLADLIARYRRG